MVVLLTAFQIPFVIWMIKGIFDDIPKEIEEQALIDGCSVIGAFSKVTFPLAAPGIVASAIFAFIMSWGEFLYALTVAIPELISEIGIYWGEICAAVTIAALVPLLFSFFVQKYLIKGLTFGAMKR